MVDKFKATVGNSQSLQTYKGLEGEVSFTSDTREVSVHDGRTVGGISIAILLSGRGEPSVIPFHEKQLYVDLDDNALYVATGTSTANDWKLVAAKSKEISGNFLVDTIGEYTAGLTPDQQEAVTDAIIAGESLRARKFPPGEITGDKIAGNTITGTNIVADTLTAREFAADTITANEIASNSLTSASGIFGVVSVDVLGAGTISASNIFLGSSRFHLDGTNERISITDKNGVLRTRLGQLGTGNGDFGLNLYKADGSLIVGLSGLGANIVDGLAIQDGAVTATKVNVTDLAAINANLGTITAGDISALNISASQINAGSLSAEYISGGTLQLTTGMEVTNSSGTTLITSSGIVASQIFIGDLSGAGSLAQQSSVADADITSIDGGKIFTNSISASRLNVSTLSAISADVGTITAGTLNSVNVNSAVITGSLIRTSSSGDRVEMDNNSARLTVFDGTQEYAKIGPQMYDGPSGNLSSIDTLGIIRTDSNFYGSSLFLGGSASINSSVSCSSVSCSSVDSTGSINSDSNYRLENKTIFYIDTNNDLICQPANFAGGTLGVDGDFFVNGVKNFAIPYPAKGKEDKELYHSTVESPTAGENLYRWRVEVSNDLQTYIELPDYWSALNGNPQVWVSPFEHFGRAYGKVNENKTYLYVYADQPGTYEVMAVGTRIDPSAQRGWKGVERPRRSTD